MSEDVPDQESTRREIQALRCADCARSDSADRDAVPVDLKPGHLVEVDEGVEKGEGWIVLQHHVPRALEGRKTADGGKGGVSHDLKAPDGGDALEPVDHC